MKHLIKYRNRKIYDPDIRKYVNLTDIKEMILNGFTVVIEDKDTGADVTPEVLATIISEVIIKERNIAMKKLLEIIKESYNCVDEKSQTSYTN
jgi:polyhydroxyalkanoate synthesis regulator protein